MRHTAKLCFPVVLMHFRENLLKNSLFNQKIDSLRKKLINTLKIFFLNKLENLQIERKIWISCKQPFLYKAVKWDKY